MADERDKGWRDQVLTKAVLSRCSFFRTPLLPLFLGNRQRFTKEKQLNLGLFFVTLENGIEFDYNLFNFLNIERR